MPAKGAESFGRFVYCAEGESVVGGGYDLPYAPAHLGTGKGFVLNEVVIQSAPIDETGDYARDGAVAAGWTVQIHRVATDSPGTATVYVLCAGPG